MYHPMLSHLDGCPYTLVASHVAQLSVYCPIHQHQDEHVGDNRHNQTDNTLNLDHSHLEESFYIIKRNGKTSDSYSVGIGSESPTVYRLIGKEFS